MSLASCEKHASTSSKSSPSEPPAPANSPLPAAHLAHAKTLLANGSLPQALAYLAASSQAEPTPEKKILISGILSSRKISIPTARFTHPYPVTQLVYRDDSLYAGLGGSFPTVVRWDLTNLEKPPVILFPTRSSGSHLSLSPDGKYLIVHRANINLLCHAETLKPIAALNPFPPSLDPSGLQPFSANSLLIASPSFPTIQGANSLTWHIHDSATGQEITSASILQHSPSYAYFSANNLHIQSGNKDEFVLTLKGDVTRKTAGDLPASRVRIIPPSINFSSEGNTIALHGIIPSAHDDIDLLDAISGYRLNANTQELEEIPVAERLRKLHLRYPEIPPVLGIYAAETPLEKRLAAAYPEEFPAISAPARANAHVIRETFATGDPAVITAAIRSLQPSGLATSTALFLAYRSGNKEWIEAVIDRTENLPPALRNIGAANAPIPDIAELRTRQDWLGFEAPDFSPLIEILSEKKSITLEKLKLPQEPSSEQIAEFIALLQSDETLIRIGASGIAKSAITAAHGLATDSSHAATAIALTSFAERYGTSRSSALRIRAVAHTTLGDYESAHNTWIDLITNQPEVQHLASDYAEAAHTAFETSAPQQAMQILETGIFRFPNDISFSIRASWIALLTNHPEQASRFLNNATRIGLPASEVENTTALLAITHTQLGDSETAHGYLEQLVAINSEWGEAETIEKLPWPEPLKASLRQLIWVP